MNELLLFTAGYEGKTVNTFVSELIANNINVVIDVRELPLSRKQGFSKNQLKEILNSHKIAYYHFKQLGSPKVIRSKLHVDGNYDVFFTKYLEYLKNNLNILTEVKDIVEREKSCIMCYEENPQKCHRRIVADMLFSISNYYVKVVDI